MSSRFPGGQPLRLRSAERSFEMAQPPRLGAAHALLFRSFDRILEEALRPSEERFRRLFDSMTKRNATTQGLFDSVDNLRPRAYIMYACG